LWIDNAAIPSKKSWGVYESLPHYRLSGCHK
jgi:hypothetical protein